jgi:hypothetical protein
VMMRSVLRFIVSPVTELNIRWSSIKEQGPRFGIALVP